jgi:dihydroorotate dehydrogenase electron transfer subunit
MTRGAILKQLTASVIANDEVMPEVYLIWLESSDIEPAARPGQFVMVRCADYPLPRPLSIHRLADKGGKLALLFNVMGKGTAWLSQRQTGEDIELFGPLGNGFSIQPETKKILMVAGGIGAAPLSFLSQEALVKNCEIKLLVGAKTSAQLDVEHLFPKGIDIIFTSEDGLKGERGLVTMLIPDYFDWADQVFACGPLPMYYHIAHDFPQLKVSNKPVQVSLEMKMGCGLGVCYGCTVKTRKGLQQVCKDGPVFALDDILWEELPDI